MGEECYRPQDCIHKNNLDEDKMPQNKLDLSMMRGTRPNKVAFHNQDSRQVGIVCCMNKIYYSRKTVRQNKHRPYWGKCRFVDLCHTHRILYSFAPEHYNDPQKLDHKLRWKKI